MSESYFLGLYKNLCPSGSQGLWPFGPFVTISLDVLLEDDNPRSTAAPPKPKNLDFMSVAELQEYMGRLEVEIQRVQAEITKKSSSRAAAEALFGAK